MFTREVEMKHKPEDPSEAAILKAITKEFNKFHGEGGGRSPERLKTLAVSAIGQGISRNRVGKAAGISPQAIGLWAKVLPRAKELEVSPEPVIFCQPRVEPASVLIRIRLPSGVLIDFPQSLLSGEFLALLNGLGGRP
jgi:hypothetical protein